MRLMNNIADRLACLCSMICMGLIGLVSPEAMKRILDEFRWPGNPDGEER